MQVNGSCPGKPKSVLMAQIRTAEKVHCDATFCNFLRIRNIPASFSSY